VTVELTFTSPLTVFLTSSADTEIEINATTIDVNGALDVSGNSVLGGTLTAASLGTSTVDLTADLMIIDDGAGWRSRPQVLLTMQQLWLQAPTRV
jgi:hypothetical protein